jgi:hypothetical protein
MKVHRYAAGFVLSGVLVGALSIGGCQASASGSVSAGPPSVNGCNPDSTIDCSGGGYGYSCAAGDNPEAEDSTLSCSVPTADGPNDDFCCFTWTAPAGSSCTPDDDLTAQCPDPDSYGYQCQDPTDDPTSLDPTLNCSTGVADGSATDFCCTYGTVSSSGGTSSGGTIPAGCTLDSSVDCSGSGADGYSCAAGDNPEAEDSSLSCSVPTTDSNGNDDYCCFGWTYGTSTCTPDDDLTSACPDPDSYGYQCDSGDDPTSLDPTLNCSTNTPDPDGVHDDYCCTY